MEGACPPTISRVLREDMQLDTGTETFVENSGTSFGVGKRGSAVVTKVRLSLSCRTRGNFFEPNDVCDSSITPACETS